MLSFITIVSDYINALTSVLFLWRFAERFFCRGYTWFGWFDNTVVYAVFNGEISTARWVFSLWAHIRVIWGVDKYKMQLFLIFKKYININISLIVLWYWFNFFFFNKLKSGRHFICCIASRSDAMFSTAWKKWHTQSQTHTRWIWLACPLQRDGDTAAERERERARERPHISLMPFSKYRSKSHTSSGPGGGALDEFSPLSTNSPTHPPTHLPTLCQAVPLSEREEEKERERERERERETMSGAERCRQQQQQQQQYRSPPAPVFIPAWALDVITAQRSTLTETESSQRQQERVRDIKRHGEGERRERERGSRGAQLFRSLRCCYSDTRVPPAASGVWMLNTHTHIHGDTHTLFEI